MEPFSGAYRLVSVALASRFSAPLYQATAPERVGQKSLSGSVHTLFRVLSWVSRL